MTKRIFVLLLALVFTLGLASFGFAADKPAAAPKAEEKKAVEVKGTVSKIDGKKITVKDAAGKETTVEVKEVSKDLKVGDMVTIKDGMVTKEAAPAKEAPKKKKAIEGC